MMKANIKRAFLLIPLLVVALAIGIRAVAPDPARADLGQLPFRGSLEAVEIHTGSFPILSVALSGTGQATDLGRFTATIDFLLDLRTSTGYGSFTLTAANGDRVFGTESGHATVGAGVASIVENATITGGTGRFADATGSFIINRLAVQATGISSGSFDGTIDFHH